MTLGAYKIYIGIFQYNYIYLILNLNGDLPTCTLHKSRYPQCSFVENIIHSENDMNSSYGSSQKFSCN